MGSDDIRRELADREEIARHASGLLGCLEQAFELELSILDPSAMQPVPFAHRVVERSHGEVCVGTARTSRREAHSLPTRISRGLGPSPPRLRP